MENSCGIVVPCITESVAFKPAGLSESQLMRAEWNVEVSGHFAVEGVRLAQAENPEDEEQPDERAPPSGGVDEVA